MSVPAMVEVLDGQKQSQTFAARVLDISEGGMQLETRDPVAVVGAEILIQFSINDRINIHAKIRQADDIEVELADDSDGGQSIVRWADGSSGKFGVEFVDLEPDTHAKLRKLVDRLVEVNGDVTKV